MAVFVFWLRDSICSPFQRTMEKQRYKAVASIWKRCSWKPIKTYLISASFPGYRSVKHIPGPYLMQDKISGFWYINNRDDRSKEERMISPKQSWQNGINSAISPLLIDRKFESDVENTPYFWPCYIAEWVPASRDHVTHSRRIILSTAPRSSILITCFGP